MLKIRPANVHDAPLIRQLIYELATYEKEPDEVRTTDADIARHGFGERPEFRALVAEWEEQPAGYALFFPYYSTWRGPGLYLEDVFVRPAFRGRGIGGALLAQVARIARDERRVFMKWEVLDWNRPAIGMYKGLGADFLDGWTSAFLTGEGLRKLAEKAS